MSTSQELKGRRVLVTGGAGYIGSIVVRRLLARGYSVCVVDNLRFGGATLAELIGHPRFSFHRMDVRNHAGMETVLSECDAVAHLAAIVGDPGCNAEPGLAHDVNLVASQALFELATKAGCKRFCFVSTCSNYGRMSDSDCMLDEDAPLAPISLYAETKVAVERYLLEHARSHSCVPTCLRFATAYGASPRVRFDLTVNEFTRELALGRELVVYGEHFWRPYCHVDDLAEAVCMVLEAPKEKVAFEVFNVGDTEENYTKRMLIEELSKQIPDPNIRRVPQESDPRDYRVNCDYIKKQLGFEITKRVPDGISEMLDLICSGLIADPDDEVYTNISVPLNV